VQIEMPPLGRAEYISTIFYSLLWGWAILQTIKIDRHVFRYVEGELYKYPFHKKIVETWDKELADKIASLALPAIDYKEEKRTPKGNFSDTTGAAALKLMLMSREAEYARLSCKAIEMIMETLKEDEKRFVEEKYFKNELTNYALAAKFNVSIREFYNMRNRIVARFAEGMGIARPQHFWSN